MAVQLTDNELAQLHTDLATVTAERAKARKDYATERAAHEETKADWKRRHTEWLTEQQAEIDAHESTRAALANMTQLRQKAEQYGLKQDAALAKAEARVTAAEKVCAGSGIPGCEPGIVLTRLVQEALRG